VGGGRIGGGGRGEEEGCADAEERVWTYSIRKSAHVSPLDISSYNYSHASHRKGLGNLQ
jgi:hypothetical protein